MTDADALRDIANTAATADVRAAARQHIETTLRAMRVIIDLDSSGRAQWAWQLVQTLIEADNKRIAAEAEVARLRKENEMRPTFEELTNDYAELEQRLAAVQAERDAALAQVTAEHAKMVYLWVEACRLCVDCQENDDQAPCLTHSMAGEFGRENVDAFVASIRVPLLNQIRQLRAALEAARSFTQPEIQRGPASDAWIHMQTTVGKALAITSHAATPEPTDARAPHTT